MCILFKVALKSFLVFNFFFLEKSRGSWIFNKRRTSYLVAHYSLLPPSVGQLVAASRSSGKDAVPAQSGQVTQKTYHELLEGKWLDCRLVSRFLVGLRFWRLDDKLPGERREKMTKLVSSSMVVPPTTGPKTKLTPSQMFAKEKKYIYIFNADRNQLVS